MIKNNKFYIDDLSFVVFLGQSDAFSDLIQINNKLNLKTTIITSSHQSKSIEKELDFKIFNNLDKKFKKFIDGKVKLKK